MASRKKTVSTAQMQLFPTNEILPSSSPSRNALITALTNKTEEVRVGRLDYDRWKPLLREIKQASAVKHSNRAKVNGEWYDVRFMKYLLKFMNNWVSREAQLKWEIEELKRELN